MRVNWAAIHIGGMKGKHHTKEAKIKIGEASSRTLKGRKLSVKHRKHLSLALKRRHIAKIYIEEGEKIIALTKKYETILRSAQDS